MSLDAMCQATDDNTPETDATPIGYAHVPVKHLGLRTCDWTQRLKALPRTRTRQSPRKTLMGRQHSEAQSCTWHQASCSRRFIYCRLRSMMKCNRNKINSSGDAAGVACLCKTPDSLTPGTSRISFLIAEACPRESPGNYAGKSEKESYLLRLQKMRNTLRIP